MKLDEENLIARLSPAAQQLWAEEGKVGRIKLLMFLGEGAMLAGKNTIDLSKAVIEVTAERVSKV